MNGDPALRGRGVTPGIPVLIVDRHRDFRRALRTLLEHDARVEVMGDASSPYDAMTMMGREKPAILLLDAAICERGEMGAEAFRRIHAASPETTILVLTSSLAIEPIERQRMRGRGAVDLVSKAEALAAIDRLLDPESGSPSSGPWPGPDPFKIGGRRARTFASDTGGIPG
jgi:DNA-binding NarL/FixJ family response regulator